MSTQQSISRSSNLVKKVEKEILMEANNEEKSLKNSIGDLAQIEKAENKAEKAVVKADIKLEKAEKKEQSSLKDLYRAEHNHGIALVDVQKAQQELETSTRNYEKLREKLEKKATRVEEAMKAHDDHTKVRNAKLTALRGPSAASEAVRIVPDSTTQLAGGSTRGTSQAPHN